ncbi:MAG: tRNA adenosine(34) deaminase TadA [Thermoguttaceae bacterium]|jgi:tRNA(adenine34) deaminase
MTSERDLLLMREAIAEARLAAEEGEVPIGAVVVRSGKVIAKAHNRKESDRDPTAHAEILAIRRAAALYPSWRIEDAELFVTMEPCPMCAGAILSARIGRVVYGTPDHKAGAVRTLYRLLEDARLNHLCEVVPNVLAAECHELLQEFFRKQRAQGKK